eukprot:23503-Prorocentrum_lima.AAC.1
MAFPIIQWLCWHTVALMLSLMPLLRLPPLSQHRDPRLLFTRNATWEDLFHRDLAHFVVEASQPGA